MLTIEGLPELGVHLSLANFDQILAEIEKSESVVWLNDFNVRDTEEKRELDSLLVTKYEGKHIDVVPMCTCGAIKDRFYIGETCTLCGTVVTDIVNRPYRSLLWMRPPEGVDCFINPQFLIILDQYFQKGKQSMIEYLCNPNFRLKRKVKEITRLEHYDFKRGINYFSKNYREMIQMLIDCNLKTVRLKKREEADLWAFIDKYEDRLFPKALPLPSSASIVMESTDMSTYSEDTLKDCVDAARTISSITELEYRRQSLVEGKTMKAIASLASAYAKFTRDIASPKKGLIRRNVISNLNYFSFRTIIVSNHGPHRYEDVVMPYGPAVKLFEIHLVNILCRDHGFTPIKAINYIDLHTQRYSELLWSILQSAADRVDGIEFLWHRNPMMRRGGIQKLRMRYFKKDPFDVTVEMSPLVLASPNADFDGDAMNGCLPTDQLLCDAFDRFEPHHNIFDLNAPSKLSGASRLPKQLIAQQANYLNKVDESLNFDEFKTYMEAS